MPDTFIRFSTTRPETMLGDTAVCVHPADERYKHLDRQDGDAPARSNREIPIIADGLLADPALGTGCVKVTPAHDPNDYACWPAHTELADDQHPEPRRHDQRERRQVRRPGPLQGPRSGGRRTWRRSASSRARRTATIPLKYSDRSKTPIEPYLSDQWFVKMGDRDDGKPGLAQMAMDAVTDGRVKFFPERYAKTYLDWLGEKRDWCISRQLWWGHRIPVWYAQLSRPEARSEDAHSAERRRDVVTVRSERGRRVTLARLLARATRSDAVHALGRSTWLRRKTPTSSTPGSAPPSGRTRRSAGRSRRRS